VLGMAGAIYIKGVAVTKYKRLDQWSIILFMLKFSKFNLMT
jgi:hypothetical protein